VNPDTELLRDISRKLDLVLAALQAIGREIQKASSKASSA